jgi:hypothetical protein
MLQCPALLLQILLLAFLAVYLRMNLTLTDEMILIFSNSIFGNSKLDLPLTA